MKLFDYVFYRVAKFYYKWDGRTASTAVIAVAMSQSLAIGFVCMCVMKAYHSRQQTYPYSKDIAWAGVLLFGLFMFINARRYWSAYRTLSKKYAGETRLQSVGRGIGVLLVLLLPLLGMLFLGITK